MIGDFLAAVLRVLAGFGEVSVLAFRQRARVSVWVLAAEVFVAALVRRILLDRSLAEVFVTHAFHRHLLLKRRWPFLALLLLCEVTPPTKPGEAPRNSTNVT
jgi:hypothetical protein